MGRPSPAAEPGEVILGMSAQNTGAAANGRTGTRDAASGSGFRAARTVFVA
jgi:hypothetical protein